MKGLRVDLIILSIVISAILHGLVMYYVSSRVMTEVAAGVERPKPRWPMRVTAVAPHRTSARLEDVEDVAPSREAPSAASPSASPTASLPAEDLPSAPSPSLPSISLDALPVAPMPESAIDSEPPAPPPVMVSERGLPTPVGVIARSPAAAEGVPVLPLMGVPDLPIVPDLPSVAARPAHLPAQPGAAHAFEPVREVMEAVDERVIAAEKDAVRDLVNVPEAADLASQVELDLAKAEMADGRICFRLTVRPRPSLGVVPKDVVVLIDASGSIGTDRLGSIRGAAKRILRSASNTGDRFNLVAFRDRFSYCFRAWQECTAQSFEQADRWLNSLAPYGRTDVFATITSVLTLPRDPARPLIALVVTDGDANAGVSDTADILSKFTTLNDGLVSVYMYGVRSSANRELIDVLTHGNRGESFIFGGARWSAGAGIEGLSERFRDPVLSDLRLIFAYDCQAEAYPRLLRNLYRGETVEVTGILPADAKEIAFSLRGLNGRRAYEGFFRLPLASAVRDPAIIRIWKQECELDRLLSGQ